MSTLTKFVLGVMGQLRPKPAKGDRCSKWLTILFE